MVELAFLCLDYNLFWILLQISVVLIMEWDKFDFTCVVRLILKCVDGGAQSAVILTKLVSTILVTPTTRCCWERLYVEWRRCSVSWFVKNIPLTMGWKYNISKSQNMVFRVRRRSAPDNPNIKLNGTTQVAPVLLCGINTF